MSLKESSDELNPTVRVDERVGRASPVHGAVDYLALAIATFGVGLLPLAPGTWGSMVGVGIYLLLRYVALNLGKFPFFAIELVVILVITLAGIWAATRTERLSGRKDPGKVVVDEVAGQMISLLPLVLVPVSAWKTWVIVSFTLFRFFDIVKPYPARRMERLHGGLGIMCDDLVAGIYAAAVIIAAIAGLSSI
ncbi:MAG TPA: phosphatidylglycerophosphatase A [Pyrinomonadaceae bacterium]|jgi:phosphatidylglycerophosphatase A|nr:phosphatidylglycerophosphatase A [Pyrinomonadaceae bacterium]